jgi:hypothetical protein
VYLFLPEVYSLYRIIWCFRNLQKQFLNVGPQRKFPVSDLNVKCIHETASCDIEAMKSILTKCEMKSVEVFSSFLPTDVFLPSSHDHCKPAQIACRYRKLSLPTVRVSKITTRMKASVKVRQGYRLDPGSIPGHWGFFPGHQTVPCALGSTQPLKMSTRIFLGVKTASA